MMMTDRAESAHCAQLELDERRAEASFLLAFGKRLFGRVGEGVKEGCQQRATR